MEQKYTQINGQLCKERTILFQQMMLEQLEIYMQKKKMNFDPYLISCTKDILNWIIGLNVKPNI